MMPDADCILYVGHKAAKDRAQGWHRDSGEYLRKGYDEQSQREQWEVLQCRSTGRRLGRTAVPLFLR